MPIPCSWLQVQGWDIAANFCTIRPARHEAAEATKEPTAAFQAVLNTAPSLASSPFVLQSGKCLQFKGISLMPSLQHRTLNQHVAESHLRVFTI